MAPSMSVECIGVAAPHSPCHGGSARSTVHWKCNIHMIRMDTRTRSCAASIPGHDAGKEQNCPCHKVLDHFLQMRRVTVAYELT
jgi:hypothetical protein